MYMLSPYLLLWEEDNGMVDKAVVKPFVALLRISVLARISLTFPPPHQNLYNFKLTEGFLFRVGALPERNCPH